MVGDPFDILRWLEPSCFIKKIVIKVLVDEMSGMFSCIFVNSVRPKSCSFTSFIHLSWILSQWKWNVATAGDSYLLAFAWSCEFHTFIKYIQFYFTKSTFVYLPNNKTSSFTLCAFEQPNWLSPMHCIDIYSGAAISSVLFCCTTFKSMCFDACFMRVKLKDPLLFLHIAIALLFTLFLFSCLAHSDLDIKKTLKPNESNNLFEIYCNQCGL